MENRNDRKSYYKGLLTGVILCVLIIGVLALSGCFLKDYAPSSTVRPQEQEMLWRHRMCLHPVVM